MRADVRMVATQAAKPAFEMRTLAGVAAPLGFFDPLGLSDGLSEG